MSGHSVLVPAVFPGGSAVTLETLAVGGAVLAAGLTAFALAKGVQALVEMQLEEAQRRACQEKARHQEWARHQACRLQQMSASRELAEIVHLAEEKLARVALAAVVARSGAHGPGGPGPEQVSHIGLGRHRARPEEVHAMFAEVAEIVASLPAAFREAAAAPFEAISKQRARLAGRLTSGERLQRDEIVKFKELIARTLDSFLHESAAHQRQQEEIHARLEAALDSVLLYQQLASKEQYSAMEALRYQLATLLTSDQVRMGQLELIENRLAALKQEIDSGVINGAHRKGLCASITRNLSELGCETLAEFPGNVDGESVEAVMRIPGGERVRIVLGANNQVSFNLIHERSQGSGGLSPAELVHIRAQEKRWCDVFKKLARRLAAEGFAYQIGFEEDIPEHAIKVVVVESPEEILEEEARYQEQQQQKRYLD